LLLRQFGKSALQITKLEPRKLIRRVHQARVRLLHLDMIVPQRPAKVTDVSTVQHRE